MTRWKRIAIALAVLWGLGAWWWIPQIERALEQAAADVLAEHPLHSRLEKVRVDFDGQTAVARGSVRRESDRTEVLEALRTRVRTSTPLGFGFGKGLNPVVAVRDEMKLEPLPSGWAVMVLAGTETRVVGQVASQEEADLLMQAVQQVRGGEESRMQDDLQVTRAVDETDSLAATLSTTPKGSKSGEVLVYASVLGDAWKLLKLGEPLEVLGKPMLQVGVSESVWKAIAGPVLEQARKDEAEQERLAQEKARLAGLAPAHVLAARAGKRLLVLGDAGSIPLQKLILEAATKALGGKDIVDGLRTADPRRPIEDVEHWLAGVPAPVATNGGPVVVLGVAGKPWKVVSAPLPSSLQEWQKLVPVGLDAGALKKDTHLLTEWLKENSPSNRDADSEMLVPARLSLALFGDRVVLVGEVADEATRSQVVDAVRDAYAGRDTLHQIRLNAHCTPSTEVFQTILSLPRPPEPDAPGVFAFAVPGDVWRSVKVTPALLQPGGLARARILPENFPAALAESDLLDAMAMLKDHLRNALTPAATP